MEEQEKAIVVKNKEEIVSVDSKEIMTVDPRAEIMFASLCASSLKDIIDKKSKKIMINGEQYIEFEDWQTLARFFKYTPKVIATSYLPDLKGWEAKAVVIDKDGKEISGADAMCLRAEPNWKDKAEFQVRSMAQTRACAKVLRNVLGWVVVLAGYKPTPAEEMEGIKGEQSKVIQTEDRPKLKSRLTQLWTIATKKGLDEKQIHSFLKQKFDKGRARDLTDKEMDETITFLDNLIILLPPLKADDVIQIAKETTEPEPVISSNTLDTEQAQVFEPSSTGDIEEESEPTGFIQASSDQRLKIKQLSQRLNMTSEQLEGFLKNNFNFLLSSIGFEDAVLAIEMLEGYIEERRAK